MEAKCVIEGMLFKSGAVTHSTLAKAAQVSKDECVHILEEIQKEHSNKGYILLNDGHTASFALSPQVSDLFRKEEKSDEPLSPSTRETLAIVAYGGPLSRLDIDIIRGVNSRYSVDRLIYRGFIQAQKRNDTISLSVTIDFLVSCSISDMTDLPEYAKHRERILTNLKTIKEKIEMQ